MIRPLCGSPDSWCPEPFRGSCGCRGCLLRAHLPSRGHSWADGPLWGVAPGTGQRPPGSAQVLSLENGGCQLFTPASLMTGFPSLNLPQLGSKKNATLRNTRQRLGCAGILAALPQGPAPAWPMRGMGWGGRLLAPLGPCDLSVCGDALPPDGQGSCASPCIPRLGVAHGCPSGLQPDLWALGVGTDL